jgi:hypothetical protein
MFDLDPLRVIRDQSRVAVVPAATWRRRTSSPWSFSNWRRHLNRRIQQARGRLQNRAISEIVQSAGVEALAGSIRRRYRLRMDLPQGGNAAPRLLRCLWSPRDPAHASRTGADAPTGGADASAIPRPRRFCGLIAYRACLAVTVPGRPVFPRARLFAATMAGPLSPHTRAMQPEAPFAQNGASPVRGSTKDFERAYRGGTLIFAPPFRVSAA